MKKSNLKINILTGISWIASALLVVTVAGCGGGSSSEQVQKYQVTGQISGLQQDGLILHMGAEKLQVPSQSTQFQFSIKLAPAAEYEVVIDQQPMNQHCSLSNAKGLVPTAANAVVNLTCENILVGQFRDAPVEGIQYKSTDPVGHVITGMTGQNGQFQYRAGDQVQFLLGPHSIGQAAGSSLLTVSSVTKSDAEAQNVARLLQSMDDDQKPENGIRLLASVHSEAGKLSTLPVSTATSDNQLQEVLTQLYPGQQKKLLPLSVAESHRLLSERLSLLSGTEMYKAIVPGEKTYSSTYYNAMGLDSSALARLRLYVWEKWQQPQFRIVQNSTAEALQQVDKQHENWLQRIEMLDAMGDVALLALDVGQLKTIFSKALANPGNVDVVDLGKATIKMTVDTASTIVTVGGDDCIQNGLDCWNVTSVQQAAKDPSDDNGPELAKTIFYGFGALKTGDEATTVNALKSLVAASTDDPDVLAVSKGIAIALGALAENGFLSVKPKLGLYMKKGGLVAAKELTTWGATGVVGITALPSLAKASVAINSYNIAQAYLRAWYSSAGNLAWRNNALNVSNANDVRATLTTLAEREGLSDSAWSISSKWDPALAVSLVAEHMARNNYLVGVYQRQLGKAIETVKLAIEGIPTAFNVDQAVTMRLRQLSTHRAIKSIRWDVSNGKSSVSATGEVAALSLTQAGAYTVRADVEFESGPSESVHQSVIVLGKLQTDPAQPTVGEKVVLWFSQAWTAIKQVLWSFNDAVVTYTASVVNGVSEKISHTFATVGTKTITATFKDASGNVLGSQTQTLTVQSAISNNPSARIAGVIADSGSPTGAVPDQGTMSDNTPGLAGIVSADLSSLQLVRVYNGSTLLGTATVSGAAWTLQLPALADGTYVFRPVVYHAGTMTEGASENTWTVTIKTANTWGSGTLPHTGITASQCYQGGSDTLVSCTSSGATALNSQQDGMRTSVNPMSYSKVGFNGEPLIDSASSWCAVKDKVTGLLWQNHQTLFPSGYTNYGDNRAGDASKYAAENATLCGLSGWRLPTVDELQTIVDYSKLGPGPTINTGYFLNTLDYHNYWSSTSYVGDARLVWYVDFRSGEVDYSAYGTRSNGALVRLVRASQ